MVSFQMRLQARLMQLLLLCTPHKVMVRGSLQVQSHMSVMLMYHHCVLT